MPLEYASMRLGEAVERFTPSPGELAGKRTARLRDYQREKVYSLEDSIGREHGRRGQWFGSILECADFIRHVYEECELGAPPAMSLGRANLERSYFKRSVGIVMAPSQMSAWTALHEAAHHVARRIAREPGHGAAFVSTLMGMLAAYEGIDLDMMEGLTQEMGVDFNPNLVESWRDRLVSRSAMTP